MENKKLITVEEKTGLIVLQGGDDQKIRDFFVTGESVDQILQQVEKDAAEHVPDVSTAKGRSAIKANVTFVGNYKTFFEDTGKELSAEYKGIPAKIDGTRRKIKEYLAILKVKTRKSLTDWEDEQKVIAAEKLAKEEAQILADKIESDHELALMINEKIYRDIEDARIKAEIAAKELAEQQERQRIEHEDQLKKEAAETARIEAENKAKAELLRIEKEKQDAINKANQEIINAENSRIAAVRAEELRLQQVENARIAADNAEKQRLHQIENARIDAKNAEERRLQQAKNAKAAAKIEAERAENKRLNDIQLAKQAEISRQQAEQDRIKQETEAREANKKWRAGVHNNILQVLLDNGFSSKQGKDFIRLAALGKLPSLTINY